MALRVKCKCGKTLKISSQFAGRKLACPACRHPFRISAEKFAAARAKETAEKVAAEKAKDTTDKSAAGGARTRKEHVNSATASRATPGVTGSAEAADLGMIDSGEAAELAGAELGAAAPAVTELQTAPLAVAVNVAAPARLDDELFRGLETGELAFAGEEPGLAMAGEAPRAIEVSDAAPSGLTYARDSRVALPGGRTPPSLVQGPKRGFWADAFYSFIYPVKPAGNAVTLLFILGAETIDTYFSLVPMGWMLTGLCRGIIFGWLASVYLSVVADTARGEDDLPGLKLEDGFLDGVIKPALKFVGAFAIVFLPAIVVGISVGTGAAPGPAALLIPVWTFAGLFVIPIVLLLFSFDSLGMIFRLDLIATTIARSLLPYLAIWLMLLIVIIGMLMASAGGLIANLVLPNFLISASLTTVGSGIAIHLALALFSTYLMLVSMRIVGLYYLHFKQRFTMELE